MSRQSSSHSWYTSPTAKVRLPPRFAFHELRSTTRRSEGYHDLSNERRRSQKGNPLKRIADKRTIRLDSVPRTSVRAFRPITGLGNEATPAVAAHAATAPRRTCHGARDAVHGAVAVWTATAEGWVVTGPDQVTCSLLPGRRPTHYGFWSVPSDSSPDAATPSSL
jgi:hypothetical protein